MGKKCAPSYANLFMGNFEKTHILPLLQEKSSLYLRFINGIFFLWNGTEEELKSFINRVNMDPLQDANDNTSKTTRRFLDNGTSNTATQWIQR